MAQSRRLSLIEAWINVLVGYFVAVGAQVLIFPLFSIQVEPAAHFQIGGFFTLVSLLRSYILRRAFNLLDRKLEQ